ncbi:MAG: PLP-dependent transferase [Hyphomicrobiales bacterium]|nr:PLP-dependent transferase [Hyphomicrobiales bacterium]
MTDAPRPSPETLLAQAAHFIDPADGAIVPPIRPSTTFARDADYALMGRSDYIRPDNATYEAVEPLLAALDGGAEALLFSSGLAAASALLETVRTGEHVVAQRIMYYGALTWLRRVSERRGIGLTLFDAGEPESLADAIRPGETALVWIETPANPTWDVVDIAAAAELAHGAGAALAVDSTAAPPVTTRALDLGADIVFHSATKYLNGHTDVLAGVLVTKETDARWQEIGQVRGLTGGVLGSFEAWLLLRGLRTLALRFERASASALKIAQHFEGHPNVARVLYPGLESHPGHAVARRQMRNGFSGMLSLLIDGDAEAAKSVATRLKLIVPATSLGGVESLVEHRKTVEGPTSAVPDNLLRFSIGIEQADELIADLEQALDGI